ncbi:SNF2-related protein [Paenibacillus sp.]|uniref:DEAD/DEAH box helicase n=1 Tax=Paenibacillus sp. TaxID=58172 RepID=UPI002811A7CA|nr:SNF2-related protein [Paenibacillus sp.]
MPSARFEPADGDIAARARWAPFWAAPGLAEAEAAFPLPVDREAIERYVDAAVRASLSPERREESFRDLHPRYGVPHTPLEKWAYGLLQGEGEPPALPDWLADDVAEWHRATEREAAVVHVRAAFALLEPETADGTWRLVPGLQAADDERLFVPARDVWRRTERDPRFGGRTFEGAQERLARGIAEAAERFPPLTRVRPADAGCALTEAEALDFLEAGADALERLGFGTVLPEWWEAPSPLEAAVHYREPTPNASYASAPFEDASGAAPAIGFDTLMSYRKELLLGGKPISEAEWRRLTERDTALLFREGRWLRLRAADRRAGARFFRDPLEGEATAAGALRAALAVDAAAPADEAAVPIRRWSGDARLERLVSGLRDASGGAAAASVEPPAALQGELRDYQRRGFAWLARMRELGLGACLADDMGLGKTVQWIAYALHVVARRDPRNLRRPLLLVCPTSVLGNWQRELERFAPSLAVYFHYGPERARVSAAFRQTAGAADVVLTSYTTALRDRKLLGATLWDAVTLDEAQYVKNSGAQLTRFVRTLPSVHRIALTGTPVENRLSDLWSIFEFLNPGYLGSERAFRKTFGDGAERGGAGNGPSGRLHALVRPFLLRRMKSDPAVIGDLPDKIEQTSYCGMTERQAAMYTAALERMADQLKRAEGIRRRGVILSTITKLKQICNAPEQALRERSLRTGASGKLLRLEELLRESLEADVRAIVFTQYATMATLLQSYLSARLGCEVGLMIGKTPRKERESLVERFQEAEDGPKVLVLSLKTGGFGLNLTRANRLVHYDRWWNPAAERQATDRAYRIGQTRTVEVWKLVTKGTLEESIEKLLESKERLADDVVGTGEQWITEYSDEQLNELLSLRRQVILSEDEA